MIQTSLEQNLNSPGTSEWENHLRSWKRSGLSKAAYCRQKEISYHGFNYWKRRMEKSQPPSPITLVKLEETKNFTSSSQKQTLSPKSPIRFWLKDFCIEVENNFSPTVLGQLVQTLRRI